MCHMTHAFYIIKHIRLHGYGFVKILKWKYDVVL